MTTDSLDSIYSLPIASRRDEIIAAVDSQQVTIITAETGAGKSTQIPQYLAEHGYQKIIVTQPRILAARNLCGRVRQEYSWRRGEDCTELVGYRTAHEQDDNARNIILYCTDGLQLVRELTGSGSNGRQILVLDEIHEWNENMEVLIAWAKKRCQTEPDFKLVLMSATIEANSLADYFGAPPPISVSGRSFPVERRFGPNLVLEITKQLTTQPVNMLVFLPGKAEIEQVTEALTAAAVQIPIIPLHSQLEPEDQQRAFVNYPTGKIILATNIAQTSITIDDIDVVIDSGLERRAEVRSGVEGLFISEISQADCSQRAGRAGRTRPGTYILAKYKQLPCSPVNDRPEYGVPEILRKHIDRLVLRLCNINVDIEELEFFHAPSNNTIKRAKRTLTILGALKDGVVTDIGHRMERFPVESAYGRMLVEADTYNAGVQSKLAAIIAIQEVGGIVRGGPRFSGWRRYTTQKQSDLLAQYDVLLQMPSIPEVEHDELGIITKNVDKAFEVYERLQRDLGLTELSLMPISDDEQTSLRRCIVAGQIDQLWALDSDGKAVHLATKKRREISSSTVVRQASLFVGRPFDLQVATAGGLETLQLVNDITAIEPSWLDQIAPDTYNVRPGKPYYDAKLGALASPLEIGFRGRTMMSSGVSLLPPTTENQQLFSVVFARWAQQQIDMQLAALHPQRGHVLPNISLKQITAQTKHLLQGTVSLSELPKKQRIAALRLAKLETWFDRDQLEKLTHAKKSAPHQPQRRKGWRDATKQPHRWRNRDH